MEKQQFYIDWPESDDEQKRLYALLDMLGMSFGLSFRAMAVVETDKAFLVPLLKELENKDAAAEDAISFDEAKADIAALAEIEPTKKLIRCLNCGKEFEQKRKDNWTCSKACYQAYQRKSNSSGGKKTHSPLPNQAKIDENLTEEEARIEAVVAKAQATAPSADMEHTVIRSGGAIMARKL